MDSLQEWGGAEECQLLTLHRIHQAALDFYPLVCLRGGQISPVEWAEEFSPEAERVSSTEPVFGVLNQTIKLIFALQQHAIPSEEENRMPADSLLANKGFEENRVLNIELDLHANISKSIS
jgi:hypothetical protein